MAEGEREVGVPDENGARCLARDRDRSDRQAFERGLDVEIDLVRAFPQSLDREVRLAAFSRMHEADVVAVPTVPSGPRCTRSWCAGRIRLRLLLCAAGHRRVFPPCPRSGQPLPGT